ncbi:unnamed protein product [Ambrosiozyma monospora]|uniref:Unnamed protein product n=1 Tax=Ambrosiozyma monospora TaxID=43982 RepID=A0A9W6Z127_AMBMO|nr:unnamed protein product [Ambrosiozyma monospora]
MTITSIINPIHYPPTSTNSYQFVITIMEENKDIIPHLGSIDDQQQTSEGTQLTDVNDNQQQASSLTSQPEQQTNVTPVPDLLATSNDNEAAQKAVSDAIDDIINFNAGEQLETNTTTTNTNANSNVNVNITTTDTALAPIDIEHVIGKVDVDVQPQNSGSDSASINANPVVNEPEPEPQSVSNDSNTPPPPQQQQQQKQPQQQHTESITEKESAEKPAISTTTQATETKTPSDPNAVVSSDSEIYSFN